jgi:hypothetical protein
MSLPTELTARVRRLDEHQLRQLLVLARGLLVHADGPAAPVAPDGGELRVSYRQQQVRCGREGCGTCPHGPYWYAHWREDGRRRKAYVGRTLPGEELAPVDPAVGVRPRARREDV